MYPRRNILYTQWKGGCVHHRASMDTGKEKDLLLLVEMNTHYFGHPDCSLPITQLSCPRTNGSK